MNAWARKQTAFTIVELLIVIVVIAILAAITIVAYTGINNRAKLSASQSAVNQAVKKIELYAAPRDGSFPLDKATFLSEAGVSDSTGMTYEYYASSSAQDYCLSAGPSDDVSGAFSYVKSSRTGTVAPGKCTVNYVRYPYASGGGWTGYNSAGGSSPSFISNALEGRPSYRWTASSAGFSPGMTIGLEYIGTGITVPGGAKITPSLMMRSSKPGTFRIFSSYATGSTLLGDLYGPSVSVAADTWTELTASFTVPLAADRMTLRTQYQSGASWVSGDWIEVTKLSTAAGAYSYGDDKTEGWFWLGSSNASALVGPATPR